MPVSQNKVVTPQALKSAQAVCTAAKSTYNDAANAVLLMTAGANGALLFSLKALPRATLAAANQLQAYRSSDAGVTLQLFDMATMAAYTFAVTSSATKTDFGYSESAPLRFGAGERIYVGIATALAGGIVFDATWEDL